MGVVAIVLMVVVGIGVEHDLIPFRLVAIKVFDFIKITIGEHVDQFVQRGHAFDPKTRLIVGGIFELVLATATKGA